LLHLLGLVLEGVLVDCSKIVLELEPLLQGRLLVVWGVLLELLGGGEAGTAVGHSLCEPKG
jgi:hypothetical protein